MIIDSVLILSFGGPEESSEIIPFLRRVTEGRGVSEERLFEVAEHYEQLGGRSPINDRTMELSLALQAEFDREGVPLSVYWGNRNWYPFASDIVKAMGEDGVTRALVITTSATGGYSSCRQYREDIDHARKAAGKKAPDLIKLRHYFDHPGFIEANADGVRAALGSLPSDVCDDARLVFTAHSIPLSMNETSGPEGNLYLAQQHETARLVAEAVRGEGAEFDLVWQSRSGPAQVPWLEPDINDHLRALAASRTPAVVVSPTGFTSDHMEVVWDLDHEAAATAASLGLPFARAATAGTHPAFVRALRELVQEKYWGEEPKHLGDLGVCGWECPDTCCPAPPRRPSA